MDTSKMTGWVKWMKLHGVQELRIPGEVEILLSDGDGYDDEAEGIGYVDLENAISGISSSDDPREEPDLYPDGEVPTLKKDKGDN